MAVTYSPSSGTTLSLNSSTTITMRTDVTSFETHINGTSGVFYWNFYDANGNGLGGSGEVGSDGKNSQTARYTATPSNYIKNGVYPSYLEVSGWFTSRYGMEFVDARWPVEEPPRSYCTPPSNPRLSATTTASSATLSWDPGGGGTNNAVTGYTIFYQDSADGSSWPVLPNWYTDVTGTSCTVYAPDTEGYYRRFLIHTVGTAGSDWISNPVYSGTLRKVTYPTITSQPTLTLGSTSGSNVTLSWNAAGVSNQNGATIYYQYFVGPSSTYSDSYLIGTTTSRSATVSESQIISKCGTGFGASSSGSTCYFFVRAYWDKNGTTGGHVTPSGKSFTYYPTLNAPTGLSLSPSSGIETTISWTNKVAGNGSMPQTILYIDGVQKASDIQGSSGGYKISKDVWRSLTCGNHKIKIAHEWYGRYAYSNEITFRHESGLISYYDSSRGKYVRCEVRYYDSSRSKYVLCAPYMYNSGWKLCGK